VTTTAPTTTPDNSATPPTAAANVDELSQLVYQEVPGVKEELKGHANISPDQLLQILAHSIIPLIQSSATEVLRLRGWAMRVRESTNDTLLELIERVEDMEGIVYGGDSQLTVADATLMMRVVGALEALVAQVASATTNEEGQQQVAQLQELVESAKQRINDITVAEEDDDSSDEIG
jgi:hypothetical protein